MSEFSPEMMAEMGILDIKENGESIWCLLDSCFKCIDIYNHNPLNENIQRESDFGKAMIRAYIKHLGLEIEEL